MRTPWALATAAVALLAGTGVALAVGQRGGEPTAVPDPADADVLLERLYTGATVEQHVAQLATILRAADRKGDGLDAGDVTFVRTRDAARARATAVGEVLPFDLDGNLAVTRAEIEQASNAGKPAYQSRSAEALMTRFDADGDGTITIREAAAGARASGGADAAMLGALLSLDPSGDARLTAAELRRQVERAFAGVDRDGDGVLSAGEYKAIAERVQAAQMARSAPACALPRVPAGARLVAYGGYEADALSSVAVGGPDQETNVLDVTIEPGREPLYLVLTSSESMIWRLSGATDRVVRVAVSASETGLRAPQRPAVNPPPAGAQRMTAPPIFIADDAGGVAASGVIGVAADRVTIAGSNCPRYFYDTSDNGAGAARASIARSVGRTPDAMFGSYSAQRVGLPSGTITKATRDTAAVPAGFDAATWAEAVRYWPGGLVRVDPRAVVARVRVAPYQVLPSQMGLAQLVGSGAAVRTGGDTFRIVRPIAHMPPSMGGAHSATLVFAKGVAVPPGDPVHSCIVREDSGEQAGARCGR